VQGRDLTGELPEDRRARFGAAWDGMVTRGGYLDAPFDFDARFFGISPKEARAVDPQHRLLLEVAWEAFEHAAIPVSEAAHATGIFVGITGVDYREWLSGEPNSSWTIGTGHSFAAGRIAHTLGLRGPVFAVDTACSSSLVSVHLACRALATGDCDAAVAGGVNLILAPSVTRSVHATGALSPDGRSRPFDAAANGFVRGEGCGMVVLKRLPDAQRAGDRVLAVINGSGINHDGRTATFTAPNVAAQADLIDTVLAAAGVPAHNIGFHEAHGTGTPSGDPSEMEAIATTLGKRDGRRLYVASVKGNLGHTESAAGVLGLIKAVLCLNHRTIAPQANFSTLNPRIDLSGTGIEIPTAPVEWDDWLGDCASISSYGMSGTNAYAVLSPAPRTAPDAAPDGSAVTGFPLSAATPSALAELARHYAEHVAALTDTGFPAFALTASGGRARLKHAIWIQANNAAEATVALRALAAGQAHPAVRALGPEEPLPAVTRRVVVSLPTYPWQQSSYFAAASA
jgi:acyl transferase domain-containing protein